MAPGAVVGSCLVVLLLSEHVGQLRGSGQYLVTISGGRCQNPVVSDEVEVWRWDEGGAFLDQLGGRSRSGVVPSAQGVFRENTTVWSSAMRSRRAATGGLTT